MFKLFILLGCLTFTACAPLDLTEPGKISKTLPDEYGVVCYGVDMWRRTGLHCVKVK